MTQKILLALVAAASLTLSLSAMSTTAEARGGFHHGGLHHGGHGRHLWGQWHHHVGHFRHCHWVNRWHHHHFVTFRVCQHNWRY